MSGRLGLKRCVSKFTFQTMGCHRLDMRDRVLSEAPLHMREILRVLEKSVERLVAELKDCGSRHVIRRQGQRLVRMLRVPTQVSGKAVPFVSARS